MYGGGGENMAKKGLTEWVRHPATGGKTTLQQLAREDLIHINYLEQFEYRGYDDTPFGRETAWKARKAWFVDVNDTMIGWEVSKATAQKLRALLGEVT